MQYVGLSPDDLGDNVVFPSGTTSCDIWFQTNATDLDGKLLAYAVYTDPNDQTPYVAGSFDAALQSGLAKTTIDDVSEIFPEAVTSCYVRTWIQDEDYVDPSIAIGQVLDWTAEMQS